MKSRSIIAVCAAALLVLGSALAGCNTVKGMGKDIQGLGRGTTSAAQSTQNAITGSGSSQSEEEE